jgi:transposase InsO family protein
MSVSERFACRVTGQNRTTQRRPPTPTTPADPDAALRDWLQAWAKDHPRRGFRNAYHDARDEGWHVNHKKIQRLWREEGLRVPQQRRRKRLGTSTTPNPPKRTHRTGRGPSTSSSTPPPTGDRSRSCPSWTSTPANASAAWSSAPLPERTSSTNWTASPPGAATRPWRCDDGPELACQAMADWAGGRVGLSFIPPGEPWRNGDVESFNSRIRDECLNVNVFWSLAQARVVVSDWKEDDDHRRRHSSLGDQAPAAYAATCAHR